MSQSNNDIEFEIKFYEGLLEKNPDFVQALALLGDLYTRQGMYDRGLKIDERLARLCPSDAIVFYNLACSYSLLKEIDKSLRSIKRAINCGYSDFKHLDHDPDLNNLRMDQRFQKFLTRVKNRTDHSESSTESEFHS